MPTFKSFTALDFETMTAARTSACAIGLAKVVDGHIIHKFYSLINPIPDDREHDNSDVHGITREMVAHAPTFLELWPTVRAIIGEDIIVAHNAPFDQCVWQEQMLFYGCEAPDAHRFFCTFEETGLSLEDACARHGIDMGHHHDALDDAVACAKVHLAHNGEMQTRTFTGGVRAVMSQLKAKTYDRQLMEPLTEKAVKNKNTPFFRAKVVITGLLSAWPDRNELGYKLWYLGADIDKSISKKTNIVIVGDSAGPAKLKKIEELRAQGSDIRIIYEPELIEILSRI